MKQNIISSNESTRQRINTMVERIKKIKNQERDVWSDIQARLINQTDFLSVTLYEYISSQEFSKTFCNWTDYTVPTKENTWEKTKASIKKAMAYKFGLLLVKWERKKQVYSKIHRELVDEYLARLVDLDHSTKCIILE